MSVTSLGCQHDSAWASRLVRVTYLQIQDLFCWKSVWTAVGLYVLCFPDRFRSSQPTCQLASYLDFARWRCLYGDAQFWHPRSCFVALVSGCFFYLSRIRFCWNAIIYWKLHCYHQRMTRGTGLVCRVCTRRRPSLRKELRRLHPFKNKCFPNSLQSWEIQKWQLLADTTKEVARPSAAPRLMWHPLQWLPLFSLIGVLLPLHRSWGCWQKHYLECDIWRFLW